MQIPPLEKARLSARLLTLRGELASGSLSAIAKARASAEALAIRTQLGAAAPAGPALDAQTMAENASDDGLSDDPNSPNYRYADTGYISGSRKEAAAGAIRKARSDGRMLRVSDIDFTAIEENPREARALVIKSNLFGVVDWDGLREAGTEPSAAFLMDRVYASLAQAPSEDSAPARKAYALGIETLRTRLERCQTAKEVVAILDEIRAELTGTMLNAEESERYQVLQDQAKTLNRQIADLHNGQNQAQTAMYDVQAISSKAQRDFQNRLSRGWKIEPQHEQAVRDAEAAASAARDAWLEKLASSKQAIEQLDEQVRPLYEERKQITELAKARNLGQPVNRAWASMGEGFINALMFRHRGGSVSFAKHVANTLSGEPADWVWSDKKSTGSAIQGAPKAATKKRRSFALKVVDKFNRKGGRPIDIKSTKALEQLCGFRAVQSGNWVLKDRDSAKWHVEQAAGAMMDMSDVTGISEQGLGFGGRLGIAFGARGRGGKDAASAHYEPIQRVFNITKMNGGGGIGHEHWHALDNILPSVLRGEEGGQDEFAVSNPELVPAGPLRDAFSALNRVLSQGDVRLPEVIKFTPRTLQNARHNLDRPSTDIGRRIKAAGNAEDAVIAVDTFFRGDDPRTLKARKGWRTVAAAYFLPEGTTEIQLNTGKAVSRYMAEAKQLDGKGNEYWSSMPELAARAFQSYLEDKLAAMDRQNDYLSCLADNKHHYFPELGEPFKPYPEGDERQRINQVFDQLFKTLRDEKSFEKALANTALLDAIFGVNHD